MEVVCVEIGSGASEKYRRTDRVEESVCHREAGNVHGLEVWVGVAIDLGRRISLAIARTHNKVHAR